MASYIMAHTAHNWVFACTPKLPVAHRFLSDARVAPPVRAVLELHSRRPSPLRGDGRDAPR
jgi:hypothetical protein